MQHNKEPVVFSNRAGQKLFGTLHRPTTASDELPIIVLLSPGIKMRIGPHRLYKRMTEQFNDLGFTVFRFDFFGLGDSEGEHNRRLLAEVNNDTENGLFIDDTIDALDWLQSNLNREQFLLGGLCGGAITGILTAQKDHRCVGLLSLGMTVTLAMGARDRIQFATEGELKALRSGYLRKLLDPKSWLRLLSFRSDLKAIFKSLQAGAGSKRRTVKNDEALSNQDSSNANPLFPKAFLEVTGSGRPVLLVFSEADRLYWEFQEKFQQPYENELSTVADAYDICVIEQANHVFSFRVWEDAMMAVAVHWLNTRFPPGGSCQPLVAHGQNS